MKSSMRPVFAGYFANDTLRVGLIGALHKVPPLRRTDSGIREWGVAKLLEHIHGNAPSRRAGPLRAIIGIVFRMPDSRSFRDVNLSDSLTYKPLHSVRLLQLAEKLNMRTAHSEVPSDMSRIWTGALSCSCLVKTEGTWVLSDLPSTEEHPIIEKGDGFAVELTLAALPITMPIGLMRDNRV